MLPLHRYCHLRHYYHRHFATSTKKIEWPSNRVRRTFIDYFSSHGYNFVPSSSVLPSDDRSLFFVNAGMNQFKPIFLNALNVGDDRSKLILAVNSQKCIRAGGKHNDLAAVGRDGTHHTFFEMLGNWAFHGNLSKKSACEQALKLLVDIYRLPRNRLFVTYFKGDPNLGLEPDLECLEIWRQLGFPPDRIKALGMDDNFWEMGASGPCGPCTEILYSSTNSSSIDDYTEIWNIVFISYNKSVDGRLTPLTKMHVDTGLGLERLCRILQRVPTNYDTDLFVPIMREIGTRLNAPKYAGLFGDDDPKQIDTSYRIIADHARMFTVAISDGVTPGFTKSGGVLRRIIKSAAYQSNLMRSNVSRKERGNLILADLCNVVADILGDAYPELITNLDNIRKVVSREESMYRDLVQGVKTKFGRFLIKKNHQVTAADLFDFYQLHGLPREILFAMVKNKNIQFDEKEFEHLEEEYSKTC